MKELAVFRCKKCASVLRESKCYTYESGVQVPIDNIEIVEVPRKNCECCAKTPSKRMMPISIDKTDKEPWKVVFWDDDYARDEGISSYLGSYKTFDEAYCEAMRGAHINDWASCEVQLQIGAAIHAVYCYATTRPRSDEFVN